MIVFLVCVSLYALIGFTFGQFHMMLAHNIQPCSTRNLVVRHFVGSSYRVDGKRIHPPCPVRINWLWVFWPVVIVFAPTIFAICYVGLAIKIWIKCIERELFNRGND